MDLIQNAIGTAGLKRIESDILIAVRKADPRPFMALLLAHLPNFTTLYAEIPELDFFVYEVFRKAANDGQYMDRPLKNLRELHICSAWNYYQHDVDYERYKYHLSIHDYPVYVFRIPSIQRFSIFDFNAGNVAWLFETRGIPPRSSSIIYLTLVYNKNFKVPISGANTSALLAIPTMLVNLCIHWDDPRVIDELFGPQISNADLWNAIQQHANSLESLDLYKACTRAFPSQHSANASHFGSIQHFTRLRRLCIQPEVLLGGCCGGSYAPFQLKDTLPPGLRSLTLYGEEGLAQNPTLSQQLRDVLNSTSFPLLDHIALESTYHSAGLYETNIDPPHYDVERACKDNGRNYETGAASGCSKGGIGRRYYQHVQGERQRMSDKLQTVRSALTSYLSMLRESTDADGDSTPNSLRLRDDPGEDDIELDTEDLDTYELPWDELIGEDGSRFDSGMGWYYNGPDLWESELGEPEDEDSDEEQEGDEVDGGQDVNRQDPPVPQQTSSEDRGDDSDGVW